MTRRRDARARAKGRLGMAHGERYALFPREVLESEAYRALPDSAARVLFALAGQFYGVNNGTLALPWSTAPTLGIKTQAKLYGGLRVLEAADLIVCTRRGMLVGGKKLASLYALTWWPINGPPESIVYDFGTVVSTIPSNAWAGWKQPANWGEIVHTITARARGQLERPSPFAARASTQREERSAHSVRSGEAISRSQREER